MKTEAGNTSQAEAVATGDNGKAAVTTLRRAGRVGLSILNPFSDFVVIYRKGVQPALEKLSLVRKILNHQPVTGELLNWEQAVEGAGVPVERLHRSYKRIRAAWWCLMTIPGALSFVLVLMLVATQFNLPSGTLIRALLATVILGCLGVIGFVKVLSTNYRLWQLNERRVSQDEHGTFQDFLAENRWFRQVLTLGMSS